VFGEKAGAFYVGRKSMRVDKKKATGKNHIGVWCHRGKKEKKKNGGTTIKKGGDSPKKYFVGGVVGSWVVVCWDWVFRVVPGEEDGLNQGGWAWAVT